MQIYKTLSNYLFPLTARLNKNFKDKRKYKLIYNILR